MKKVISFLTIFALIFSAAIPVFAADGNDKVKYWYKGAGLDKRYKDCPSCSYYYTDNEWTTLTVHQFYNPTYDQGRAKIRGVARTDAALKEFPGYYVKVSWISTALKDVDPDRNNLWISDIEPDESSSNILIPQWMSYLAGYFSSVVDVYTNNVKASVEYWSGGAGHKRVRASNSYGLDLSVVDAPLSVSYTQVEDWSSKRASNGKESGFTGMFLYHINGGKNYKLQGWSQTTYTVTESNFLYSFAAHSGYAYRSHYVNTN
jgi:hypothetical protein